MQRCGSVLICLVITVVVLFLVWPHLEAFVSRPFRKWLAMGLIVICVAPWLLWETLFPPVIDITAYRESVDYEFRDAEYAYEFAELNGDAPWVKVS